MLSLVVTVFIVTVHHTEGNQKLQVTCPKWRYHYLDISFAGKRVCRSCTPCRPGYRQVTHCTKVNDTYCEPCRRGTYASNSAKRCRPCHHCRRGRKHGWKCTNIEHAQCQCPKGRHYRKGKCNPCTACLKGTYMTSQCSFTRDTQCHECPEGTFSTKTSTLSNHCAQCSDCRGGELIVQSCNATHDTVCGECRPGMFRLLSTHECVPCSPCYPDVDGNYTNSIIIDECRRRNPDQSRICMPSVTTSLAYVGNFTDVAATTNVTNVTYETRMKVRAPSQFFEGDDGGFALFIVACIVIALVCLMLISLGFAHFHKKISSCEYLCYKSQTNHQHAHRNLLADYLTEQRSSQPFHITKSHSAQFPFKTTPIERPVTTLSLEGGILRYFMEDEFHSPVVWDIGNGPPSATSYSDILSVSATGTLSSTKDHNISRVAKS